jgi:hypothetical protein
MTRFFAGYLANPGAAFSIKTVISDGILATGTPTAWNAAILSAAVPEPPDTIAPA